MSAGSTELLTIYGWTEAVASSSRGLSAFPGQIERILGPLSTGNSSQRIALASIHASIAAAQQLLAAVQDAVAQLNDCPEQPNGIVHESLVRSIPRWHFPMLNDLDRNEIFATALKRVVPVGSHVLDIGTGTGLLAMLAAEAGAASVTACEANPLLAEISRQIIAQHELSNIITVIPKLSTDLLVGIDLLRPADVIVAEIVDCGLVGEGLLPTIRHARKYLLAPGGVLLPRSARIAGALVDSVAVGRLNRVDTAAGFDVGLFNEVATKGHFPVRLSTWPHRLLSQQVELTAFDFATGLITDGDVVLDIPVTTVGVAHAVIAWFEMTLTEELTISNSANNLRSHWMQACVPFPEPFSVRPEELLRINFSWRKNKLSVRRAPVTGLQEEMP